MYILRKAWLNNKAIELTEPTVAELQDAVCEERTNVESLLQNPNALANMLQQSRLEGEPHASNAEILTRLNALELRLDSRLDRLERLLKAALGDSSRDS